MTKIKSAGKCIFCQETYASKSISRHLGTHLKNVAKENPSKEKSYHLKIVGGGSYFLHLLIQENLELIDLDDYLRQIWLECCGHLSSFEIKGARKTFDWSSYDEEAEFGLAMNKRVGDVFKKGQILTYDYDFGSTTRLEIKVMNEYFVKHKEALLLLSRNEPLQILCALCKKEPAEVLCLLWHNKGTVFCSTCKTIHAETCSDFAEYSEGKIVNSPRAGVCAYDGGTIDLERDGVWQK